MKQYQSYQPYSMHGNIVFRAIKQLKSKVSQLFEPQEVEVNFTSDGRRMRYTYRKVERKQVA